MTSLKPGDILFLVGAAFSLAASAFFPALVLGVFWKRANKWGAIIGMVAGSGVCMYYMCTTYPFFSDMGVPQDGPVVRDEPDFRRRVRRAGRHLTIIVVSLLTPPPDREAQELVEHVRYPHLRGDTVVSEAR